jgi:solute carrier family 25 (mitochondrial carnitine/acylcarnitine transporter), member 20/29
MAVDDGSSSSSNNDQVVEASISSSVDFVAGWAAGAVAVLCVQPIDTWLTRFQAASSSPSVAAASTTRTFNTSPRSLWRGSSPMIWSVPMQNALLMGGYGVGQKFFPVDDEATTSSSDQYDRNRQLLAIFVGGCTGGLLQSFFMSPVELIKVTQQINVKSLSTASIALSMKWTSGLNATILRDGIPHGVWFVAYDVTKTAWQQQQQSFSSTSSSTSKYTGPLVAGAVAATVAWGVGYPADLIKTRIQAASSIDGHNPTTTIRDVARDIIRQSGYRGLYKGFGLKLVRSIPASMIGFSVYELVKDAIINVR